MTGCFCLISSALCVVVTITTTVIHMNRLVTFFYLFLFRFCPPCYFHSPPLSGNVRRFKNEWNPFWDINFRLILKKSQPNSLSLKLHHFLLNLLRQKLWHHQEFVLTYLKIQVCLSKMRRLYVIYFAFSLTFLVSIFFLSLPNHLTFQLNTSLKTEVKNEPTF